MVVAERPQVPQLQQTLETIPYGDNFRASTIIKYLMSRTAPVIFKPVGKRKDQDRQLSMLDRPIEYKGNLDIAVLQAHNHTHVTPRIAQMALPLFREVLRVVGPRPPPEPEMPKADLRLRVQGFLIRTQNRRRLQFRPDQRIRRSRWLKYILIDDVKYEVAHRLFFLTITLRGH